MAWAMNIPSITIFGNTPFARNTYTTDINLTISSNIKVNPLKIDKNNFSIMDIEPKEIFNLLYTKIIKKAKKCIN
jgi:heptosyltransferase-1